MALKTDYKDDILDVSQNTKRKYTMIENQDGTVSFDDETVYSQEGDSFGASDINAITEAVNSNSGMPVGTIATFDGTTLPSGFEPYQTEEQRAIAQINDNLSWYVANGWLPAIPSGDVPANMEDCSWPMLQQLAAAGTLGNYYSVGDTKTLELSGGERVVMELASINDGEGTAGAYYPRGTADFISKDCMLTTRQMNTSNTNSGGWPSCKMRTDLNNVVYVLLPQAVKDAIVEKTHKSSAGGQSTTLVEHSDKLWLPTEWEIFGSITYAAGTENGNVNKHYAVFDSAGDRIKHLGTGGAATAWWECSPYVSASTAFCRVTASGEASNESTAASLGVPLCFRIGQLFT